MGASDVPARARMSMANKIETFVTGRIAFPVTNYSFNRRNILQNYKQLCSSERMPRDQIRELQLSRLRALVKFAGERIPFYADRFRAIGLDAEDIKTLDDVVSIPPVSRQDVIDHHRQMVDSKRQREIENAERSGQGPGQPMFLARIRRNKLVRNTSSGSTGWPTVFFEDGSATALNWAHDLRLRKWFGVEPGEREARLARMSTDFDIRSRSIRFRRLLWGQLLLPGVNLQTKDCELCLAALNRFRPSVIWGFTSALAEVARYMLATGESFDGFRPKMAIGWAAPLYEHEERVIAEAFRCPVTNVYGSREVGHVAGRCPAGKYHLNEESLLVEVDDSHSGNGEESGEILVTTLSVSPMPFIRYRMGDIGFLSGKSCSCGRTLGVFGQLLGRTGEIFRTKDGRMISPNFWCRTFMNVDLAGAVQRFQVIYTKEKDLRVRIVKGIGYSDRTEDHLRTFLRLNLGERAQVTFNYVSAIDPETSGKYQMVVNEAQRTGS